MTTMRILLVGLVLICAVVGVNAQVTTVWQKAAIDTTLPAWFSPSASTERGFAYGNVGGNDRLYVVSRNGGTNVVILDAATGDSVGVLKTSSTLLSEDFESISATGDPITGWTFTNTKTYVLSGYGHNSDKYAGWDEVTNGDHSITTPVLANPRSVTYWIAAYNDASNLAVIVQYSADGVTWVNKDTVKSIGAGGDFGLAYVQKTTTFNLNGNYQIRWQSNQYVSGGFYLDDIVVSGGVFGGTFALNDIDVSTDGVIFAGNLSLGSGSDTLFKAYKWTSESADPEAVIVQRGVGRHGDKITVAGSTADNSVVLYAPTATSTSQVKFTTTDNAATFTASVVTLSDAAAGSSPSIGPVGGATDGFYLNGNGVSAKLYAGDGTLQGTISGGVIATGSNAIRYFTVDGHEYVMTFQYGSGNENARIVRADGGPNNAITYALTTALRVNSNGNGTGDIAVKDNGDGTVTLYVLSTNNGLGAYTVDLGYRRATFTANTATVPDTLKPTSIIQLRGDLPLFGPWGYTSQALLTNIPGEAGIPSDYWQGTYWIPSGRSIPYKFFTNANSAFTTDNRDQGWENNTTDASSNRIMNLGLNDTTFALQFVNGSPSAQAQYWRPYAETDSTVEIMFRVNMQSNEGFNRNTQKMGVRGSLAPLDWGKTFFLTRESQHGNGGSQQYDGTNFWSGTLSFPKTHGDQTVYYKFVVHNLADTTTSNPAAWEDGIPVGPPDVENNPGNPARIFSFASSMPDTTLRWKWWANKELAGFTGADTVIVTYQANLNRAISEKGFAFGDTLEARAGYGNSASQVYTARMTRVGLTTLYQAVDTIVTEIGNELSYQYYLVKNNADYRELYYDFNFTGSDVALRERRRFTITGNTMTVRDTATSNVESRRAPRFRNQTKLAQPVTVTYTVDVRPAIYQVLAGDTLNDIQGGLDVVHPDSVLAWGVAMNGPAVGGWASWGAGLRSDTARQMFDDGTHGDAVAGDSIFTRQTSYTTNDIVGQEFKFGIGGGDNEGGFGNNHIENIDDSQPTSTLPSQFGSIDPIFYWAWDFDKQEPNLPTDVEDQTSVPLTFSMEQNYPNPFNPTTTIVYTIPMTSEVTLKVYNLLGQVVADISQGKQIAGKYTIIFDASRLTTGVYFYQIEAGDFHATKKMLLMK